MIRPPAAIIVLYAHARVVCLLAHVCKPGCGLLRSFCFLSLASAKMRRSARRSGTRAAARGRTQGHSGPDISSLSNEALVLQLQQHNLTVSSSRAAREARLRAAHVQTSESSQPQPGPSSSNGSLHDGRRPEVALTTDSVRSLVRDEVAAAVRQVLAPDGQPSPGSRCSITELQTALAPATQQSTFVAPGSLPTSAATWRVMERVLRGEFVDFNDLLPEVLASSPAAPLQLQLSSSEASPTLQLVTDPTISQANDGSLTLLLGWRHGRCIATFYCQLPVTA